MCLEPSTAGNPFVHGSECEHKLCDGCMKRCMQTDPRCPLCRKPLSRNAPVRSSPADLAARINIANLVQSAVTARISAARMELRAAEERRQMIESAASGRVTRRRGDARTIESGHTPARPSPPPPERPPASSSQRQRRPQRAQAGTVPPGPGENAIYIHFDEPPPNIAALIDILLAVSAPESRVVG